MESNGIQWNPTNKCAEHMCHRNHSPFILVHSFAAQIIARVARDCRRRDKQHHKSPHQLGLPFPGGKSQTANSRMQHLNGTALSLCKFWWCIWISVSLSLSLSHVVDCPKKCCLSARDTYVSVVSYNGFYAPNDSCLASLSGQSCCSCKYHKALWSSMKAWSGMESMDKHKHG